MGLVPLLMDMRNKDVLYDIAGRTYPNTTFEINTITSQRINLRTTGLITPKSPDFLQMVEQLVALTGKSDHEKGFLNRIKSLRDSEYTADHGTRKLAIYFSDYHINFNRQIRLIDERLLQDMDTYFSIVRKYQVVDPVRKGTGTGY